MFYNFYLLNFALGAHLGPFLKVVPDPPNKNKNNNNNNLEYSMTCRLSPQVKRRIETPFPVYPIPFPRAMKGHFSSFCSPLPSSSATRYARVVKLRRRRRGRGGKDIHIASEGVRLTPPLLFPLLFPFRKSRKLQREEKKRKEMILKRTENGGGSSEARSCMSCAIERERGRWKKENPKIDVSHLGPLFFEEGEARVFVCVCVWGPLLPSEEESRGRGDVAFRGGGETRRREEGGGEGALSLSSPFLRVSSLSKEFFPA